MINRSNTINFWLEASETTVIQSALGYKNKHHRMKGWCIYDTMLQVCHNIYRIKTCMDVGKPVILLNLDDLYESLYDALNQYFSTWGDRKFVDLGLGTHRVKTFVNENFRY